MRRFISHAAAIVLGIAMATDQPVAFLFCALVIEHVRAAA